MQGIRRTALILVAAAALAVAACAPALAKTRVGPCPLGDKDATCDIDTGKVTFVGDGDTMSVDVDDDGTKKAVRVRVTGIQAMEETYYTNVSKDRRGECHANEAADRLAQLVKQAKNRVQLAAMNPDSTSRGRYRRMVAVKIRGKWHDLGRILVKEGHALFLSSSNEWAWNRSYSTIAQQAATRPL